jgi:uncharacterized membrane protein
MERSSDSKPVTPGQEAAAVLAPSLAAAVLPVVTGIGILLLIFLFVGHQQAAEVAWKALAIATVAGKFAPVFLPTADGLLSTPWHVALLVVYMDLTIGVIAVFNVGLLFRIPGFGAKLAELRAFGDLMLRKNPWMGKATFIGTCAFVMFPLSGTGAIGGSLFGQLLGMSRNRTMFAILVGAFMGSFGMAAIANHIPRDLADSIWFKLGGLAFILIAVGFLTNLYKRMDSKGPGGER